MLQTNELLIFGTKNMSVEIKEMAEVFYADKFAKISMVYFSDDFIKENNLEDKINRDDYKIYYIIGFGGTTRKQCIEALKKYSNFEPVSIIHPTAVIAKSASLGKGCFIHPQVTISTNAKIGDHCVINYNASVGHDAVLEDNVFIQPGARVSGNCHIGENTLIGSNSFVYQAVKVGKDCLIDALTYVRHDLPERIIMSLRYKKPISRDEAPKIPMWD
jgi:sugar O-acyltransferase (sialic acid O-acetyltransferase NeuD family)